MTHRIFQSMSALQPARIRRALLLGTAIGVLAAPGAAVAQDREALGDIIVTAQRRAEAINDIGMSLQALPAETLKELRVNDVRDLTTVVPGLTVAQSYQGVPTYTLRGIGFNTINMSATSTVGTYTDEVAYAYPIMNTGPMIDIERIEVLKGPQGTLYGRNTTAGLINFVTGKPSDQFGGSMNVDVGNYETLNVGGHLTGPIAEGIQARIGYQLDFSNRGWQISNSRGDRQGKVLRYGVRGSLALQPGPFEIDLSATYWRNRSDTMVAQPVGFTPATNPATGSSGMFTLPAAADYVGSHFPTSGSQAEWNFPQSRMDDIGIGKAITGPLKEDNWFLGLKGRVQLNLSDQLRVVSLTSYNEFDRDAVNDWSGVPYEVMVQQTIGHIKSFAEELRVEGDTDRLNWLIGGYFARDTITDRDRISFNDNANPRLVRAATLSLLNTPFNSFGYTVEDTSTAFRTFWDEGNIKSRTWSVFGNLDYAITEQLKLTLGARYTEDKQDYVGCSRDYDGSMLPNVNVMNRALYTQVYGHTPAPITANQCVTYDPDANVFGEVASVMKESNFAWRGVLDYRPTDATLLYLSISRGYKSGTTPINSANIARQNAPVTQERLTAYEVGTKLSLFERLAQLNVAGFYYDYKDKQISALFADPIYTALSQLDNVPKSKAYGVEAELTVRPAPPLTLMASGLWLKTRIDEYLGVNAAGQPQDFAGARFIYAPEWTLNGTALLDTPLSERLNLTGNVNVNYVSRQTTLFEVNPLYDISSHVLVNGGVGVKAPDGRWSASLWARNLFNKYYWNAVSSNANIVVRFPGRTRTFGGTVAFNF